MSTRIKLTDEQIRQMALEAACNDYMSDYDDPDALMQAFNDGIIPPEVSVWAPFEHFDARELSACIGCLADVIERLMKQARDGVEPAEDENDI